MSKPSKHTCRRTLWGGFVPFDASFLQKWNGKKSLVRMIQDLLRVSQCTHGKQGLELSTGGFGHGDFKRTLGQQNRLLFHGSMLLGFTI